MSKKPMASQVIPNFDEKRKFVQIVLRITWDKSVFKTYISDDLSTLYSKLDTAAQTLQPIMQESLKVE